MGTFSAYDPDGNGTGKLYYKLTPDSVRLVYLRVYFLVPIKTRKKGANRHSFLPIPKEGFSLVASGVSEVRVVTTKTLDYDKNKSFLLELYVQVSSQMF